MQAARKGVRKRVIHNNDVASLLAVGRWDEKGGGKEGGCLAFYMYSMAPCYEEQAVCLRLV